MIKDNRMKRKGNRKTGLVCNMQPMHIKRWIPCFLHFLQQSRLYRNNTVIQTKLKCMHSAHKYEAIAFMSSLCNLKQQA